MKQGNKKPVEGEPPFGPRQRVLDEILVLRAQEGSREAFRQLISKWQEPLWRHAYRLTGHEDAAWDVVQDSWLKVTRGIGKLRDPASFRRWAYTIVTRTATNRLREKGRGPMFTEGELDERPCDDSAESNTEREQAVGLLRSALRQLPAEQRILLSLRYLEDFEYWELAEIFGLPEGTVKSRLHHARKRLKEILERMQ